MRKNHHAVPASYVFLRDGDKILLMLRQNTGYYDDWYCVPAGHVEEGELPLEAAIRETREEIGVELVPEQLTFIHTLYRTAADETGDRCDYFFVAKIGKQIPKNMEPEKCSKLAWFSVDELPENFIHHQRIVLEAILEKRIYTELNKNQVHQNPNV